ncbi:hypothetical protein C8R44DRAFT_742829 [Mycena epipterygia]|nr:hypothetical protein C8R44DRAFT_742829 [Mycena epipterygia]
MCMDNLQLIVQYIELTERWGHVHVEDCAQDINAVGSKLMKKLTLHIPQVQRRHRMSINYRVKEDISDEEDFEGAQEQFRCLRLDTKVDKLDEVMNEMIICKENKNKKITVHVESAGVRPINYKLTLNHKFLIVMPTNAGTAGIESGRILVNIGFRVFKRALNEHFTFST